MKSITMSLPELGTIAVTRGMLGAGMAFLLGDKISSDKRKAIGLALVAVGVLSTVPLLADVMRRQRDASKPKQLPFFVR